MVDQHTLRARAVAQARATGRPVEIVSERTATTTLWANPSGTYSLDSHAAPVRIEKDGTWHVIDSTLVRDGNGMLTPTAVPGELTISSGGPGPFVTVRSGLRSLALKWPTPLPAPLVDGAKATFAEVFPGVDLEVIAEPAGGFRQHLVVKSAVAASNPALDSIHYEVVSEGVDASLGG